ncbi:FAD-binding oxidoreductase [Paracoccus saliphilus]|uniref:D-lactate dehydrogenase (cytochrome) n=1 Tax=Paracoccus saliphilus TaxID=405559 RepID=A0AA46A701_9RHOB|nr:FAD-linked oxidase C-terminal domain-containing protein [Paracoccus saliphilus]WCR03855.1 FAD-binding protein [Paracoccus saliphilus]SIT05444.1 D-lactate dehydrogenase (cytochrome) [Paracoccus saliphilus]
MIDHGGVMQELRVILGERVQDSEALRAQHGENESWYPQALPDFVAFPRTTDEVSRIMHLCHRLNVPVTAQGARSAIEGQHLAVHGGLALDMTNMNKIVAVHESDLDAVVQPGVTREQLNAELRTSGLFFPVDPGANATIGGMASTRASGTTAVRYGTMRDVVLALEVVRADGRVIRTGSRARKSSNGYDLTSLFIGAEGTLGIITEITVQLSGIPEAQAAAICRMPSVEDAVNAVIMTIQLGMPIARIELLDEKSVHAFNLYADTNMPEAPHLMVEFHGSERSVKDQSEAFGLVVEEFGGMDFTWSKRSEERNRLWTMRHNSQYAERMLRAGPIDQYSTDICVPISKLSDAVAAAYELGEKYGMTMCVIGHAGDGNFHCGIVIEAGNLEERARAKAFSDDLARIAIRMDGTISGEHGVGMGKVNLMREQHGDALDTMQVLKSAMDPKGILNPGKIFPA